MRSTTSPKNSPATPLSESKTPATANIKTRKITTRLTSRSRKIHSVEDNRNATSSKKGLSKMAASDEDKEEAAAPSPSPVKIKQEEESSKKTPEKKSPKVKDWPLRDIKEPHDNDVLYGRGGGTNHHPGNKRYRKMVEDRKVDYVNSKRLDKPLVALDIIRQWRGQDPPGRFLKLNEDTGLWSDVGDKKAREKTSQALREKAPLLRKQQEEEAAKDGDSTDSDEEEGKTTDESKSSGFEEEKKKSAVKKPSLIVRDTTVGPVYIDKNDKMDVKEFSFESPLEEMFGQSSGSHRDDFHFDSRVSSLNSHMSYTDPAQQGRYDSWGGRTRTGSYGDAGRTGSYGSPGHAPYPRRDGSYGRQHSLSQNPLREATTSHPAVPFDDPAARWHDYPAPPMGPPHYGPYHPPPPRAPRSISNGSNSAFARSRSISEPRETMDDMAIRRDSSGQVYRQHSGQYSLDPGVASAWSRQSEDYERVANLIGEDIRQRDSYRPCDYWDDDFSRRGRDQRHVRHPRAGPQGGSAHSNLRGKRIERLDSDVASRGDRELALDTMPRPSIVKRATSNQNETDETKRTVKRCVLSRFSSKGAVREHSLAGFELEDASTNPIKSARNIFNHEEEMQSLGHSLEKSKLYNGTPKRSQPQPARPAAAVSSNNNSPSGIGVTRAMGKTEDTTEDIGPSEFDFDFDKEPVMAKPESLAKDNRLSTEDVVISELRKPETLKSFERMSTVDAIDQAFGLNDDNAIDLSELVDDPRDLRPLKME